MARVRLLTQGAALGYVVLPLRGVSLASFDTPSPIVSVRRPIGFRSPSDRIPFAVRLDSVRCTTIEA